MTRKGIPLVLMLMVVMIPVEPTGATGICIDTEIPEYILEDHINLTGQVLGNLGSWREYSVQNFSRGSLHNVSTEGDQLALMPGLDVEMLNGGRPVLTMYSGWDSMMVSVQAVKEAGVYYIYYQGTTGSSFSSPWSVGVATSDDGVNFTKYSGNPIISARVDSFDYIGIYQTALLVEDGTWKMWYAGNRGTTSRKDINVCYATSTDGLNWTKRTQNPILLNDANNNAWDGTDLRVVGIINEGGQYRALLIGDDRAQEYGSPQLGMATSQDGVTGWTMDANNPLYRAGSGWEGGAAHYCDVEAANGTYRVWSSTKSGPGQKVGYCYSMDGVNWSASIDPVISPTAGTIYSKNIRWPTVIDEGDHYTLYAQCHDQSDYRTYGAFKLTPLRLNGTYTSELKDLQSRVILDGVHTEGTVVNGTAYQVRVRYGNTTHDLSPWHLIEGSTDLRGVIARYVQYRVGFRAEKDWMGGLRFDEFELTYGNPISDVEYRADGGPWYPASTLNDSWYADIPLRDGDYDIEVRATAAGGVDVTETIPVKVDLYPPTGDVVIEEGRAATNSTDLMVDVQATDTHGPIQMMLSTDPGFAGAIWRPYAARSLVPVPGTPDGAVSIYCRLMDAAGRVSETYSDSIILDTTPPQGSILIDDGAEFTRQRDVTLNITWWDLTGVEGMMLSNYPTFSDASWIDPSEQVQFRLLPSDGERTVYLALRDSVGLASVFADTIVLDTKAPDASFLINRGDGFTSSVSVLLAVHLISDGEACIRFTSAGVEWTEGWIRMEADALIPWELERGTDGERTVLLAVKDMAGNQRVLEDTIVLDTTPPVASLYLQGTGGYTGRTTVTAVLEASDEASGLLGYYVSNTEEFPLTMEEPSDAFDWRLTSGDGLKTVHVKVVDKVRNAIVVSADITLDTVAPEGSFTIEGTNGYTNSTEVFLHMDFTDALSGVDAVGISHLKEVDGVDWTDCAERYGWTLEPIDGQRTVYVHVRDLVGNTWTTSGRVILDRAPPVVTILSPKETSLHEGEVVYRVQVFDELDTEPTVEWRLDGGEWATLVEGSFKLSLERGSHSIEIRGMDAAGNSAVVVHEVDVTFDYLVLSGYLLVVAMIAAVALFVVFYVLKRPREGDGEGP